MTAAAAHALPVLHLLPDETTSWRDLAARLPSAHMAHAPEWAVIIQRTYGHVPLYLAAEGSRQIGLLPAFVIRRPLLGTVVSSMPFLDGGGPCSTSPAMSRALVERLVTAATQLGATAIELRSSELLDVRPAPREHKVNMVLPLDADPDAIWKRLDGGVRNQVRKAERSGLTVDFGGEESLDGFYAVFGERMRELGSPVHARQFFRTALDAFGTRARIAVVRQDRTIVGGLVAIAFKDTLVVPWASCATAFRAQCPNMLLYWSAIRTACTEGFTRFDFGRSTRGSGTYNFKRQWGALEQPLYWYSIPLGHRSPEAPGPGRAAEYAANIWRRLPLAVTQCLGPHVRKYLVQ